MNSPTLSIAMIVLNEEQHLPELVARLAWADEVVVVDGGSRDRTVEIARAAGARVAERPFDTFAKQRNHALSLCTSDWVLSIDADERPTPRLAEEIGRRIVSPRHAAYRVPIKSTILGRRMRFAGTQDDRPIRLFRRDAARWEGDVHEVLRVAGRVGRTDGWLEHHTLPDFAQFSAKMRRYTGLAAREHVSRGRRPWPGECGYRAAREFFRRLVWKLGILDGPMGWSFCALSGWSAWVEASTHRQLWAEERLARRQQEGRR
jgi:glycosyltransferase involved in cell wall biosynthesis